MLTLTLQKKLFLAIINKSKSSKDSIMSQRNNSIPLYIQIQEDVIQKIDSGEWKVGWLIPTEKELSQEWKINRLTLRAAFDILEQKGYILRIQGKGTFVRDQSEANKQILDLNQMRSPRQKLIQSHGNMSLQVLKFIQIEASEGIAELLEIPLNTPLFYIERIRSYGGIPSVFEKSYIIQSLVPHMTLEDLEKSKHDYIRQQGLNISHSIRNVKGVIPSNEIQENLKLSRFAIVMHMESRTYLDKNQVLELVHGYYNQDIYRFKTRATFND